jgi:hypothetical protein
MRIAEITESEKRYYDRAMFAEQQARILRAGLESILSFEPIPNGEKAFRDCQQEARDTLARAEP